MSLDTSSWSTLKFSSREQILALTRTVIHSDVSQNNKQAPTPNSQAHPATPHQATTRFGKGSGLILTARKHGEISPSQTLFRSTSSTLSNPRDCTSPSSASLNIPPHPLPQRFCSHPQILHHTLQPLIFPLPTKQRHQSRPQSTLFREILLRFRHAPLQHLDVAPRAHVFFGLWLARIEVRKPDVVHDLVELHDVREEVGVGCHFDV